MGIIDFSTSCPWELYLFAFCHLFAGVAMYLVDACSFLTMTPCTGAELFFGRVLGLLLLYVGVIFAALTYYNKQSIAKITRLSNFALNGAIALLVSVVFTGNASFTGGIEPSWMHKLDMLIFIVLVGVLSARVAKPDAEWAQINPINEGMGINCKTLLLLFLVTTTIKFVATTDFIDPAVLLPDGSKMTHLAVWMWKFTIVLLLEVLLALGYAVLFEDDAGHEVMVLTIMIMTVVGTLSILSVQKYMSDWMATLFGFNTIWIKLIIVILVCMAAILGGRRGGGRHFRPFSGYQEVASNA